MNNLDKYNVRYNDDNGKGNGNNNDTYNSNDPQESYIYESCSMCGKDMTDIEDIWLEIESDNYICLDCKDKYDLSVVRCAEY